MKKDLHKADKLFVQLLEGSREEPPESNWQIIENELNRQDAERYKAKYTFLRRTLLCLMLTGGCLLLSFVLQEAFHESPIKDSGTASSSQKSNNEIITSRIHQTKKPLHNKYSTQKVYPLAIKKGKIISTQDFTGNTTLLPGYNAPDTSAATLLALSPIQHTASYPAATTSLLTQGVIKKDSILNERRNESTVSVAKQQSKRKHSFTLIPYFSFDHITGRFHEQYKYDDQEAVTVIKKEKPDMSYTFGLLSEYHLSNKISLQTGLLFSNSFSAVSARVVKALQVATDSYKFKISTTYGLAEIRKGSIMQPQQGDSVLVNNGMLRIKTIAVPVVVKYKLFQGKLNLSTISGVAINQVVSDKAEVEYMAANHAENEIVQNIEGVKKTYFSLIGGVEIAYSLNKKMSIAINPVVRYAITPVNKSTPVKTYPVIISAGASIRIKL